MGGGFPAQPFGLPAHLIGDGLLLAGLPGQEFLPARREILVGTLRPEIARRVDLVDFQNLVGHRAQKGTVVCRHQVTEIRRAQQALQPQDAGEIQMVGRFVQQQQVGFEGQFPRQTQPFAPTARQFLRHQVVVVEADPGEVNGRAGFPLVVLEVLPGQGIDNHLAQGFAGLKSVILGQIPDPGPLTGRADA